MSNPINELNHVATYPITPAIIIKAAGVVERTIQDQVDNNEGWRKWFFSNNRQDDSGAMKHPLSSDALWLRKTSGLFTKKPYTESYKENKRQHDEMHQGEMPYDERSVFWPLKSQFKRMPSEIKKDYEMNMLKKAQAQVLKGGKADNKSDKDFDPKSLKKGMKVEREHTSNPKMQKEIAQDHLTEDKKYYEKLEKMEKKAGVNKFVNTIATKFPKAEPLIRNYTEAMAQTAHLPPGSGEIEIARRIGTWALKKTKIIDKGKALVQTTGDALKNIAEVGPVKHIKGK